MSFVEDATLPTMQEWRIEGTHRVFRSAVKLNPKKLPIVVTLYDHVRGAAATWHGGGTRNHTWWGPAALLIIHEIDPENMMVRGQILEKAKKAVGYVTQGSFIDPNV
jgi:hypothetical protein